MLISARSMNQPPIAQAAEAFRNLESLAPPYDGRIDTETLPASGITRYLELLAELDSIALDHHRFEECHEGIPNYDPELDAIVTDDGRTVGLDSEEGIALRLPGVREHCSGYTGDVFAEEMEHLERNSGGDFPPGSIAHWINVWFADPDRLSADMTADQADELAAEFLGLNEKTASALFHPTGYSARSIRPADVAMALGLYHWTGQVLWDILVPDQKTSPAALRITTAADNFRRLDGFSWGERNQKLTFLTPDCRSPLDHFLLWLKRGGEQSDTTTFDRDIAPAAPIDFWLNVWFTDPGDLERMHPSGSIGAAHILNLSHSEEQALLDPFDAAPSAYCPNGPVRPAHVADVLDRFLDTGVMSWEGLAPTCAERDCADCSPL